MAKFTTGSVITKKFLNDYHSTRIYGQINEQTNVIIENVIENDWNKTSFYIINEKRWPIPYVEKHYKMKLGSLLKQL